MERKKWLLSNPAIVTVLLSVLMSFYMTVAFAQSDVVKGIVLDEQGEPIIGANIVEKGTTNGTVTDLDGKFTLKVGEHAKILVSYIGMQSVELFAKPRMNISLKRDVQELDDVIVVAYGTAKKSTFTGSAASVNASDLAVRPITNVALALEGTAPGIQVKSGYGQPGAAPEIRIRGFGSINASSAPLYVIDGTIYDESAFADINPADIESISILKDAASTSLYGSSAGNGVVLVTTKRGKSEKPTVSLSITQGISGRSIPLYDRLDV